MTKEEFENFKKIGEEFYKNYLQKNPVNIKDYGKVSFGRHNRGKDNTINYEQYHFLRRKLRKEWPKELEMVLLAEQLKE